MNTLKMLRGAVVDEARNLYTSFNGRFALVVVTLMQLLDGLTDDEPWWAIALRVVLAPVWLLVLLLCLQFLSGVAFALIHARRPKHCYVVLDLKDGRQRRAMVCAAPCCMRGRLKSILRDGGRVNLSLGDGSDDEEFAADEIEDWRVIPVDNPQPHEHGERA